MNKNFKENVSIKIGYEKIKTIFLKYEKKLAFSSLSFSYLFVKRTIYSIQQCLSINSVFWAILPTPECIVYFVDFFPNEWFNKSGKHLALYYMQALKRLLKK